MTYNDANNELEIEITHNIRLGQLMKLAGLVDDGLMAEQAIQQGQVKVNGCIETQRGRQIFSGDIVEFCEHIIRVKHH